MAAPWVVGRTRVLAVLTVSTAVGGLVFGGLSVANAVDAPPPPGAARTVFGVSEIQAAPPAVGEIDAFVLEQARAGRPIDAGAVCTATVQDLTLVYEQNQTISSIAVDRVTDPADPENGGEAFATTVTENEVPDQPAEEDVAASTLSTGAGLAAAVNGAKQQDGACHTLKGKRGNLTACWARYKVDDDNKKNDYFFYDRWATANGKSATGPDNIAVKIDLRSQAKKNITGMVDYAPRTAITNCTQAGDVSLGYQGLSVSMPLSECEEVTPYPDAGANKMRNVYDQGAVFSGRTHGLEMGVVYSTKSGKTSNADHYSYARFCKATYLSCSSLDENPNG